MPGGKLDTERQSLWSYGEAEGDGGGYTAQGIRVDQYSITFVLNWNSILKTCTKQKAYCLHPLLFSFRTA